MSLHTPWPFISLVPPPNGGSLSILFSGARFPCVNPLLLGCVLRTGCCSALSAMSSSDLVLAVGTSLMVWSAFRLIKAAKEAGAALAIVNVGATRADDLADLKVEALAGEVMMRLASHPALLLPRTIL